MKIESSAVLLTASSVHTEFSAKSQSITAWSPGEETQQQEEPAALLDISAEKDPGVPQRRNERNDLSAHTQRSNRSSAASLFSFSDRDRGMITALQQMIEALTGKKFHFAFLDGILSSGGGGTAVNGGGAASSGGWGMTIENQEYYEETDSVSFSSEGSVQTSDGRTISFSVDMSMSRQFVQQNSTTLRLGNAYMCDPLVVNFDTPTAGLSDQKFSFDLDADGKSDQISSLLKGSGFLALDKNGDGVVNDGNELFGTKSGNGFTDLAAHDSDGNNWIDENDPIYDKLRIWSKDENGESRLIALGEVGIGAVYLGNAVTEFGLKNEANESNGQLRRTGVFLRENGSAGTIQHIDLAL